MCPSVKGALRELPVNVQASAPVDDPLSPNKDTGAGPDYAALLLKYKAEQSQLRASRNVPNTGWVTGAGQKRDPLVERHGHVALAVRAHIQQPEVTPGYCVDRSQRLAELEFNMRLVDEEFPETES